MPRRSRATKRTLEPDSRYDNTLIQQVINKIMLDGKKSTAEKIVYQSLDLAAGKMKKEPEKVLEEAIGKLTPPLEVRPRRVGGATYQVPMEVPARRGRTLAVRWLVSYARGRREHTMRDRLANELMDALNDQGGAYKKREDTLKMAQANKAFAHYRW